jgi:hypothetical protein
VVTKEKRMRIKEIWNYCIVDNIFGKDSNKCALPI